MLNSFNYCHLTHNKIPNVQSRLKLCFSTRIIAAVKQKVQFLEFSSRTLSNAQHTTACDVDTYHRR